jgi:hypothetical protein
VELAEHLETDVLIIKQSNALSIISGLRILLYEERNIATICTAQEAYHTCCIRIFELLDQDMTQQSKIIKQNSNTIKMLHLGFTYIHQTTFDTQTGSTEHFNLSHTLLNNTSMQSQW